MPPTDGYVVRAAKSFSAVRKYFQAGEVRADIYDRSNCARNRLTLDLVWECLLRLSKVQESVEAMERRYERS
jgi:hypothetical protein